MWEKNGDHVDANATSGDDQAPRLAASQVGARCDPRGDRRAHEHTRRAALSFAAENAAMQQRKRLRAQEENLQLREALLVQSRFVQQIQSLCVGAPVLQMDRNWHDLLHSYTRLPADESRRRSEFRALTTESRLRYAMRRLATDTQSLPTSHASIHKHFAPLPNGLAAHTVGVYALDTTDVSQGLRAVCVAIRDIAGVWPQYERAALDRNILYTDTSSACPLLYGVDTVFYTSGTPPGDNELVVVQTRAVTSYSVIDGCGLVMWDFVDEDELHPAADYVDIQRCAIGACLLRVERCEDGENRVVCRMICSKKYVRTGVARESAQRVDRFLDSVQVAATSNGTVFKDIVMRQVAEEELLLSIAHSAC